MKSPIAAGPYATLPNKKRAYVPQLPTVEVPKPSEEVSVTQSLSGHQHLPPMAPLALRRCNSVEVLFPEEDDQVNQAASIYPPPLLRNIYSRSTSVNSLDLATSTMANPRLSVARSLTHSESNTSVVVGRYSLSPLPEEDARTLSRRSSTCSITVVSVMEVGLETIDGGFKHIAPQDEHREAESRNSSSAGQSRAASSPSRTDSSGSSASGGDPGHSRQRRRSSADIAAPLVAIASHAIALTCYYFGQ